MRLLKLLLFFLFYVLVHPAMALEVGGIEFEDNAFPDAIISTDYSGGLVNAATIQEALLGSNLNSYIDYDTPPSGQDPSSYIKDLEQFVELGFIDNDVYNGTGDDLVFFEAGSANAVYVCLDTSCAEDTSIIVPTYYIGYYGGHQMNAGYLDLTVLGVPEGEKITSITVSSWRTPHDGTNYGVPETAAVGALYSTPASNRAPVVEAGADQFISLPENSVELAATVTDDGLPGTGLVVDWQLTDGPAAVVIDDATSETTLVSFEAVGTYTFQITVDDGELTGSDTVTITLTDPDYQAPDIVQGLSAQALSDQQVELSWQASTDNVAVAGYRVYRDGSEIASVTDTVFFDSGLAAQTSYSYYVVAFDAAGNTSDPSDSVSVTTDAQLLQLDVRIISGNDDAEEGENGTIQLTSSDLELVDDVGAGNQLVGIRFSNLQIPQGAQIGRAWVEFETDEVGSTDTSLFITAQDSDDAAQFSAAAYDISSRFTVNASVAWDGIDPWTATNEKHQSPDLSALLQQVIDRAGWVAGNAVAFIISGYGTRTAESYDGEAGAAPLLHVEYSVGPVSNRAPVVEAGADQFISLPENSVELAATVTDDGLPGTGLVVDWQLTDGPAAVVIDDATSETTLVSFEAVGTYTFQITVDDGELTGSDTVTITLTDPDYQAPDIVQGLSAQALSDQQVELSWQASTDNVAVAGYRVYRDGSEIASVTDTVFFDSGLAAQTSYSYYVVAFDAAGNTSDPSDSVSVTTDAQLLQLDVRIISGNDDAEEGENGTIQLTSSDLELVDDVGAGNQLVGIRFSNLQIPQGAQIGRAWVEFETDEVGSTDTSLFITAQDSDDAAQFSAAAYDISSRFTVNASVAWDGIDPWTATNEKHQSPDLSALLQQVIDRAGWVAGNAVAFIISGYGTRTAESYDGEAGAAPLLHVEYSVGPVSNRAPVVEAGADQFISLPENSVELAATVTDDGLPGTGLVVDWQLTDGPAAVVIDDATSETTLVSFEAVGTYTFQITVDDGELTGSDTVTITLTDPDYQAPDIVQGLSAQALSDQQVELSWQASTDNVAVAGYRVYRDGSEIASVTDTVFFDSGLAAQTSYSYYVVAFDAAGNTSDPSDSVSVTTDAQLLQLDVRIISGNDDAEEGENGTIQLTSSDLELVDDVGAGNQLVGIRFSNLQIPQGAQIGRAWVEFETDEVGSTDTSLFITAQDSDDAAQFSAAAYDISSRFTVNASVAWDGIDPWTATNEKHQSPDLSALLQQVIDRAGWVAGNAVAFIISGYGTRTAESYDGEAGAAPLLHVEYSVGPVSNRAPVVEAGADQFISLPENSVELAATVTDDGLPGTGLVVDWQLTDGPAAVVIDDATSETTLVSFEAVGTYTFQITVDDGELTGSDTVTITLTDPDYQAPDIVQGLSAQALSDQQVELSWQASTDNVAVAGYRVYRDGSEIASVTDTVFFDSGLAAQTSYSYYVVAFDAAGNTSDPSDSVSVTTDAQLLQLDVRIISGNDDAEEGENGTIQLTSSDLELVDDVGAGNQLVGIRFSNLQIPQGAQIGRAWVEFETDEVGSTDTSLFITAQDSDDAAQFSAAAYDISSRFTVNASVAWDGIDPWTATNEKHQSPDLSALLQQVIDRAGWVAGNAVAFIISGYGTRTAESYDGEAGAAPLLHVEYSVGPVSNRAPVVEAGADQFISLPENSVELAATVTDDGLPGTGLVVDWQLTDGPAAVVIDDATSETTLVSFEAVGTYTFQITVDDGELTGSDTVTITLTDPDYQAPDIVQGLSAQALSDQQVELSWQASTDNVAVAGYRVYRDGSEIASVTDTVFFDSGLAAQTSYSYYVVAFDAAGNTSDPSDSVSVTTDAQLLQLDVRIISGNDDAEEGENGTIQLTSSDLELVDDVGAGNQLVGIRFSNLQIPQGAQIGRAWVEFETDEVGSTDTSLFITAQDSDDAAQFSAAAYDISSRFTVNASVAWDGIDPWTATNEKHQSPDLSALLQQVIDRAGWVAGNAVAFIISGYGTRTAESYDGEAGAAPQLHVEYSVP